MAGQAAPRQDVLDALVGGDFDPEEYDRQMAAAFGEDYYGAVSALGRLAVGAHCGSAVHAVHAVLCCAVLCCAVLCCVAYTVPGCARPGVVPAGALPPGSSHPSSILIPCALPLPAVRAARAVQDADGDEDDLEDEAFEKELEAMAKYGSDDEEPQSFAALHKRLTAQRREQAAAGARGVGGRVGGWLGGWAGRRAGAGLRAPTEAPRVPVAAPPLASIHSHCLCALFYPCRRRQRGR